MLGLAGGIESSITFTFAAGPVAVSLHYTWPFLLWFPAASVAVTENWLLVFAFSGTATEKAVWPLASCSVPTTLLLFVTVMRLPASAVPVMVTEF